MKGEIYPILWKNDAQIVLRNGYLVTFNKVKWDKKNNA